MELSQKLILLRKEKGISQEALAELVGVSRQAISKWESGQSSPDINNLITLSEIYKQSIDDMLKDNQSISTNTQDANSEPSESIHIVRNLFAYEYKSKRSFRGIPLVHINMGYGFPRVAKGIFAVGNVAIGAVAMGGLSVGAVSLGGLSAGLLFSLGGLSIGGVAIGGLAAGILAAGGLAIGISAFGGCAVASQLAIGGAALSANVAVGGGAHGLIAVMGGAGGEGLYRLVESGVSSVVSGEHAIAAMRQQLSAFWNPVLAILSAIL